MKGKSWSTNEVGILSEFYPTTPYTCLLAKLPGRTVSSIHTKATDLKVRRRRANGWLTNKVLQMSDVDKGFVAGMLEGEGTIGIYCQKRYNHADYPKVQWINTDLPLLQSMYRMLGGKGSIRHHNHSNLNRVVHSTKPCYALVLSRYDDIRQVLENIEPYLISKKQKAQAVLGLLNEKAESLYERRAAN